MNDYRRTTAALLVAAFAVVVIAASPPHATTCHRLATNGSRAATTQAVPFSGQRLINYGSGLCLQPEPESGAYFINGLSIIQYFCLDADSVVATQQHWSLLFVKTGSVAGRSGSFNLYHFVNDLTGQCLDDRDGNTADGAPVQQWTCNSSSTTMLWTIGRTVGQYAEFINSRSGKCLDIRGGVAATRRERPAVPVYDDFVDDQPGAAFRLVLLTLGPWPTGPHERY